MRAQVDLADGEQRPPVADHLEGSGGGAGTPGELRQHDHTDKVCTSNRPTATAVGRPAGQARVTVIPAGVLLNRTCPRSGA
ncbi:hypothetical protein GCM10023162_14640 [Klenkia terrae]